jgi:hypothetical protein
MKTKLKPPGTKLLKLEYDTLVSTYAFNFKLWHYTVASLAAAAPPFATSTAAATAAAAAATAAAANAAAIAPAKYDLLRLHYSNDNAAADAADATRDKHDDSMHDRHDADDNNDDDDNMVRPSLCAS